MAKTFSISLYSGQRNSEVKIDSRIWPHFSASPLLNIFMLWQGASPPSSDGWPRQYVKMMRFAFICLVELGLNRIYFLITHYEFIAPSFFGASTTAIAPATPTVQYQDAETSWRSELAASSEGAQSASLSTSASQSATTMASNPATFPPQSLVPLVTQIAAILTERKQNVCVTRGTKD